VPTYVYKFLETGETIEVQQSFDDPTLTEATHPVTGITMAVKKVFLPVGVTFKGDGFYKTDSRTTAKSSSGSASSADPAGSSAPDSATTANAPSGSSSAGATSSASPAAGPASSSTSSSD
jgi:predicted nucleic acid-binding Zn ribbon protein